MAHLATALRDPLIVLGSDHPWTGNIPTIVIGLVNEHYLEDEWNNHKKRILALFKITDPSFLLEVKANSTGFGSRVLDDSKLGEDTSTAIQIINCLETNQLRIIHLGVRKFVRFGYIHRIPHTGLGQTGTGETNPIHLTRRIIRFPPFKFL